MNRSTQHAFDPEDVMAYLDGELNPHRAATLATHLEHCDECRTLAAQLRQLSERLLDFEAEPMPEKSQRGSAQFSPNREIGGKKERGQRHQPAA
jgi:anti-sigma factor RsiW